MNLGRRAFSKNKCYVLDAVRQSLTGLKVVLLDNLEHA